MSLRTLGSRVAQLAIVLVAVTFGCALLARLLPVDLAELLLPVGTDVDRAIFRKQLGLDKNVVAYYLDWLGRFVRGDFGDIYFSGGTEPVADRIARALPRSVLLMVYTQVVSLAVAIPLGVWSAYRVGRRADRAINNSLFVISAVPSFAIGLTLIILLGVRWQLLPTLDYVPLSDGLWPHLSHMIMPVLSLSVGLVAVYTRLLRADMVAVLREDYITMAASKGLSNTRILWCHALRPASITLFTSAALNMGALIGGAIVIETIFATYGIGFEIFLAIQGRQYLAIQSLVALIAIFYVVFNLAVDVLAGYVDPRTRDRRLRG